MISIKTMDVKEDIFRQKVVEGAKKIYERGLCENSEGNLSVRNDTKEEIYITPTANYYELLTKEQISHIDFKGTPLTKGTLPSTEVKLHIALYKARPKVRCVIHTHSPYATTLSIAQISIPIIMEEQVAFLGGSVDLAAYAEAHTENIASSALESLGIKNATLLSNHGVITCGKSVSEAIKFAELVEKLAKMYWGALQVGKPNVLEKKHLKNFYDIFNRSFANHSRNEQNRQN